jgi:large subunit ribosomal protein L22
MRQFAALVKGMHVGTAEQMLRHVPKGAAVPLAKVIKSATANALAGEGTAHHKADDLVVTDVRVDGGPIARRFRATGMGRAYRIRKRYCHVRVTVSDVVPDESRRRKRAGSRARTGAAASGDAEADA